MSLSWPSKDPDEVLDYSVDWTDRLSSGDTLSTSTFSLVYAAGVTIDSQTNTTTGSTVWLSGGTLEETAIILCRVTTAQGRTIDQTITLNIRSN